MATFQYPLQSVRLKSTYFNKLNGASIIANNAFFGISTNRIDIVVDATGESITSSLGTPGVSTDTNVSITGVDITSVSGDVDAFEKFKINNLIKIEKAKNDFIMQEKELVFIYQNKSILDLKINEKTLSFCIINKEIKFTLENT